MRHTIPWAIVIGGVVGFVASKSVATNPVVVQPGYQQTYSASYRDDPLLRRMVVLMEELVIETKAMRVEMKAQRIALEPKPVSVKALFTKSCMPCHSEANAADKRIVLIDKGGNVPVFSQTERKFILREVESGRMPKDRQPLTETEKAFLTETFFPTEKP